MRCCCPTCRWRCGGWATCRTSTRSTSRRCSSRPTGSSSTRRASTRRATSLSSASSGCASRGDLELVSRRAAQTTTIPADLNWVRLEEWRAATASVFDPPHMRGRVSTIRRVRVVAGAKEENFFGDAIESLLYAGWLMAQAGEAAEESIDYRFERRMQSSDTGQIASVEIVFEDGSAASISRDRERGVLVVNVDGPVSV